MLLLTSKAKNSLVFRAFGVTLICNVSTVSALPAGNLQPLHVHSKVRAEYITFESLRLPFIAQMSNRFVTFSVTSTFHVAVGVCRSRLYVLTSV